MTKNGTLWGREPALILGAVAAIIMLAVGFGLPVTPEQVALINSAVAAVVSVLVRRKVSPVADGKHRPESIDPTL